VVRKPGGRTGEFDGGASRGEGELGRVFYSKRREACEEQKSRSRV